jgi:hypothetical protein
MPDLQSFTAFLGSLQPRPELYKIKTFEDDLRGVLNPSMWLNKAFFEESKLLNFREFYEYYLINNQSLLRQSFPHMAWEQLCQGLEARLYRTQFGMLTEYHAYYLSQEVFGASNVIRNVALDKIGVDFQIIFNNKNYNIHIFVDTERAWSYRKYKVQHKQGNSVTGIHVNLPYSLQTGRFNSLEYLPNRFGVYTKSYMSYLKNEMLANRIQNDNIIGTNANGFIYR